MDESSSGSGATPGSGPSSAPEAPAPARRGRFALAVAIAAAAACWNPLGAPFAIVAGLGAAALGARDRFRGGSRRATAAAIALGAAAALAAIFVVLSAAGGLASPGRKVDVEPRGEREAGRVLDDSEARTRAARERAAQELQRVPPDAASR